MVTCQFCGAENPDGTRFCISCGKDITLAKVTPEITPPQGVFDHPFVETHLVKALMTAIFCFMPVGVVAVVYAVLAEDKKSSGNFEAARRNAQQANKWANIALIIGIILITGLVIIGIMSAVMISNYLPEQPV
jgi:uncharacterized metal-binding protein